MLLRQPDQIVSGHHNLSFPGMAFEPRRKARYPCKPRLRLDSSMCWPAPSKVRTCSISTCGHQTRSATERRSRGLSICGYMGEAIGKGEMRIPCSTE